MTPRDGLPRFSARSVRRGDAGHRKAWATPSESLGKPPFRSRFPLPLGSRGRPPHTVSGGHPPVAPRGVGKACRWPRIACAFPPAGETGKAIVWVQFS